VVGLGMASRPHALALHDLRDVAEVRAIYSPTPSRREKYADAFGFPVALDIAAIAADPAVDAVLILTPPNARADLVRTFAHAGKHILMEKPVERTTAAAEAIVAECRAAGVTLGIVFQQRFRDGARRLGAMLAAGALGPIGAVRVATPWWRTQGYYDEPGRGTLARDGGGVLLSQAIHTLDLLLSLTGPVTEVQAIAATTRLHRMETEDFVAAGLRFANGAPGSLVATTAAFPGGTDEVCLDCENACAELRAGVLTVRWRDGREERHGEETGTGGGADPMAFSHAWHKALIFDFIEAIKTGRQPAITGHAALRVHRLIDALLASSAEGRAVQVVEETNPES
jgi:predicted dehydrogenase